MTLHIKISSFHLLTFKEVQKNFLFVDANETINNRCYRVPTSFITGERGAAINRTS